jgi:hypothetical protein
MNTERATPQNEPEYSYKLKLTMGYLDVVRNMGAESVRQCEEQGDEPHKALRVYSNLRFPFLKFSDLDHLSTLGYRLKDYSKQTELVKLDYAIGKPYDQAREAMDIRVKRGELAKDLAEDIEGFVEMRRDLESPTEDANDWLARISAA